MGSQLNLDNFGYEAYQYLIPHVVIHSQKADDGGKPLFLLHGEAFKVEEFARRLFKGAGYEAFYGEDANFFFSMLSFNFEGSFFLDVYKNWVGSTAEAHLVELKSAVSSCIAASSISHDLLDRATNMVRLYYKEPPKSEIHLALANAVRHLDTQGLLRAVHFFRGISYTTKGVPDLFLTRGSQFWFVEVKSFNDSLSPDQYNFIEHFTRVVGGNISVLRVL